MITQGFWGGENISRYDLKFFSDYSPNNSHFNLLSLLKHETRLFTMTVSVTLGYNGSNNRPYPDHIRLEQIINYSLLFFHS